MDKEQENQFKEKIKEIARLELKNSFNNNLMETLNSAFIFEYVDTLEKQSQKYKEVIDKAKTELEQGITFCQNDSQVLYDKCSIAINREQRILDILKEVE